MRILIFAAAIALALMGAQAQAQTGAPTPDQLALAREVVVLSGAEETMNQTMRTMAPQMADQIVAGGASREFASRFVTLFLEEFAAEAPRVAELAAVAYAGAFNEAELGDLRDFYASPTGRKLVARTPELSAAMMRAGTIIGEQVAQRALARMQSERPPENP